MTVNTKPTMNGPLDLHPKTTAAAGGGALGIVVVWLLGLAGVTVDPIVAAALASVVAGFGAWLAPLLSREKAA